MWALATIFTMPSQSVLRTLVMLIQPKKNSNTKKNWPPKKSDNWAMLGLNKDFGKCFEALCCVQQLRGAVLELGLVQQALA